MKKFIFFLLFLFTTNYSYCQLNKIREYSFSQLFKMMTEVTNDSSFYLSNARIVLNTSTDQRFFKSQNENEIPNKDTIVVDKSVYFSNVLFDPNAVFNNIHFKREIMFNESGSFKFYYCRFDGKFTSNITPKKNGFITLSNSNINLIDNWYCIESCSFNNLLNIYFEDNSEKKVLVQFNFLRNTITTSKIQNKNLEFLYGISIYGNNITLLKIENNVFNTGSVNADFIFENSKSNYFTSNRIKGMGAVKFNISGQDILFFNNNNFDGPAFINIGAILEDNDIEWPDLKNGIINSNSYSIYYNKQNDNSPNQRSDIYNKSLIRKYITKDRIENEFVYNNEISLRGKFLNHYRETHNTLWANEVYIDMKNLETQRLAYLYKTNHSFETFFKWKINQFLKIFSAYGTEPAKAIIVSIYVILIFGFVYLFFPNTWDTVNRNKLMNRIRFFAKYFRQKEGLKEIYESEHNKEIMNFDEFKDYMNESEKEIPRYFMWLAKPIYNYSVSNYRLTNWMLIKSDVLKGKWTEFSEKRKFRTSLIMAVIIFSLVLFDLIIKILNALALSVNTFTTLGFGEIPLKGIPRYLAIMEGFIGWFMLTIFSVSLISQLLN